MPLVEQELLLLPEHLSSSPVFSRVRVTRSLVLYVCFVDRCLSFCIFSFGHCVVCSSIYDSYCPFGIFKLFLQVTLADFGYPVQARWFSYSQIFVLLYHLAMRVPDERYSRNAPCAPYFISTFIYTSQQQERYKGFMLNIFCIEIKKIDKNRLIQIHIGIANKTISTRFLNIIIRTNHGQTVIVMQYGVH